MAGLLLELRRQLSRNRRKNTYSSTEHRKESLEREKSRTGKASDGSFSFDRLQEVSRANTCERTPNTVSKDDFLLQQIDDFRERAQQLQNLMNTREEEVRQMERIRQMEQTRQVEQMERARQMEAAEMRRLHPMTMTEHRDGIPEEQMQRIEQLLNKKDENTAALTAEVERRIDDMIAKVSAKMEELDASVQESVDGENRESAKRAQELKESLGQIEEQLESLKADLSDKVHTENVKCYRNIQDLFKNMDAKLDEIDKLQRKSKTTKTCVIVSMIFAILNFATVIGMMLLQLGIVRI